jgi:hypothetical protein
MQVIGWTTRGGEPATATRVLDSLGESILSTTARSKERAVPELRASLHATGPGHWGVANRGIFAIVNEDRLRRILTRTLDEKEFLSPYGVRALSRYHEDHPYDLPMDGHDYRE